MMSCLPENVSTYGGEVDFLFYLIYYITAVTFLLVAIAMVTFLILYRHREGRRARYFHGHAGLEFTWTLVTFLIMITLAALSQGTWAKIKGPAPATDLQVQVTAKQFNWEILYPGPDGKFGTKDDRQMDNEIHVPVNRPVRVILKSKDVIHSLFLPNLRFKQDAVPGRAIDAWFEATKVGKYEMP
ncbi:MAG: cytochrome c oxidase subunit II, partial [Nitrospinota bacterium]